MREHPYYQQLRQIALNNGYTVEQVENATKPQVANLLGVSETALPGAFVSKMKHLIVADIEWRELIAIRDALRNQLDSAERTWLRTHYPDFEFDWRRVGGKLCIEIWLYGKPKVGGEQ